MRNKIQILLAACMTCLVLMCGSGHVFAAGTLSIAVSSANVAAGDTVEITVYAVDENNTDVTADMNISYDTAKLEYVSSSAAGAGAGGGKVTATGSTVSIKFKAVASGDAYVKAEGAALTAAGTHIMVGQTTSANTAASGQNASALQQNTAKSGDNSLSSLGISPGTLSPSFKSSITEYTATVGSDVDVVTVVPVTSNSKAAVQSVAGNSNLKDGENVITIVVKAENGTEATYKITVTKGASAAATATTATAATGNEVQEDTSEGTTANAADDGNIVMNGVNYKISNDFADADIPKDFSRADFEYKGAAYKGVMFDYGLMGMYYLESDTGEKKFFAYDAYRDRFYPYVRLDNGEHFIILTGVPNGAIPPDNYEKATLTFEDGVLVEAYQYAGEDKEIVDLSLSEAGETEQAAFYIFYAMDNTGVAGWYQYDAAQKTYQRLNGELLASADTGENYDLLLNSYNELSERHKETRTSNRRTLVALIFITVVLLIVIINLILKIRELKSNEDDYEEDDYEEDDSKTDKVEERRQRRSLNSKRYRTVEEPEEDGAFYDEDDEDIMGEFEDNPGLLSKRTKKREKSINEYAKRPQKRNTAVADEQDSDIEFFDLNDL